MASKTSAVKEQNYNYKFFSRILKGQFWLRDFFATSRKAELNQKLNKEDTFNLKKTIFASGFILFNFSLFTLYAVWRLNHKKIFIPALLLGFTAGAYQIGIVWLNRQFLRAIENTNNEQGYYLRRRLLQVIRDQKDMYVIESIVGSRLSLIEKMNRQYEMVYFIEDNQ